MIVQETINDHILLQLETEIATEDFIWVNNFIYEGENTMYLNSFWNVQSNAVYFNEKRVDWQAKY